MRMSSALACGAVLGTALLAVAPAQAQPRQRPLTETWTCENNRVVQINYHPRRERVPAWITYLGNRIEVRRKRAPDGNTFASSDGKVSWQEDDGIGTLNYADLLDAPLACRRAPR